MKKRCPKCNKTKPLSEFYKNRTAKDGHTYKCKLCILEWHKKHDKTPKRKQSRRNNDLKKRYGITLDEHLLMYILQNGRCDICREATAYDEIKTDHCHKTGKLRGLLCRRCNFFLAVLDNEEFIIESKNYLEKHRSPA